MNNPERYRIRALDRALLVMRMLNQYNGLNASALSRLVKLPRPTVLRLLQTLGDCGYVIRSDADGCFRLSRKVRELSSGFNEADSLRDVVRPFLEELTAELIWPVAMLRLCETGVVVEALTDQSSNVLERRDSPGIEMSPLSGASGYLLLALAEREEQELALARIFARDQQIIAANGLTMDKVLAQIEESRVQGYAVIHHLRPQRRSAVSVPLRIDGEGLYALNLRIAGAQAEQIVDYVPRLMDAARELTGRIVESKRPVVAARPELAPSMGPTGLPVSGEHYGPAISGQARPL